MNTLDKVGFVCVPNQWGWCMDGNELYITQLITGAMIHTHPDVFTFVEMGVGACGTTRAVCQVLEQLKTSSRIIGMDLPNDPFRSRVCAPVLLSPWWVGEFNVAQWGYRPHVAASILLKEFPDAFANELRDTPIHCVLIDACHCEDCAERDFLLVEDKVPFGGVVIFHDASPMCQDANPQAFHGGKPIRVRHVLNKLGLLTNERPGWGMAIDNIHAHHGIAAFQRR